MWTTVITAAITGGVFSLVQFLITRHDTKQEKKDGVKATLESLKTGIENLKADIDKKFKKSEKDGLRTQLLVLILLRPTEHQEILTIGEHYFKVLKGDWYMTSIFNTWLLENGIGKPDWFDVDE